MFVSEKMSIEFNDRSKTANTSFQKFVYSTKLKGSRITRPIITKCRLMKSYKYLRPKRKSSKPYGSRSMNARFENSKPNLLIHTRQKERHGTSSNAMGRPI
jgi:hypothetical protein